MEYLKIIVPLNSFVKRKKTKSLISTDMDSSNEAFFRQNKKFLFSHFPLHSFKKTENKAIKTIQFKHSWKPSFFLKNKLCTSLYYVFNLGTGFTNLEYSHKTETHLSKKLGISETGSYKEYRWQNILFIQL